MKGVGGLVDPGSFNAPLTQSRSGNMTMSQKKTMYEFAALTRKRGSNLGSQSLSRRKKLYYPEGSEGVEGEYGSRTANENHRVDPW